MGLSEVAASPRQGCGPWSCNPASVCAPSANGAQLEWDGCSLKDWEPPACQTQELQCLKLSVEGRGWKVCEAAVGPVLGVCPDTAFDLEAQRVRVGGTGLTQGYE